MQLVMAISDIDWSEAVSMAEEIDEETLAAIDLSVKAAEEGHLVPIERSARKTFTLEYKILFSDPALIDFEDLLEFYPQEQCWRGGTIRERAFESCGTPGRIPSNRGSSDQSFRHSRNPSHTDSDLLSHP